MSLTRWARSSMSDPQSYDERVSRLADSRRSDSAAKRAAVLKALNQLQREDRRISRKVVIARAGVHRNFLQRHKDLADLIDGAAGGARADSHLRPRDRIGHDSLITELAHAKQRNLEIQQKVRILEHRLGVQGPTLGPAIIDQHPVVVELRRRLAQTEVELVDKDRTIASLQDDVEVLRETNRSLVREYGLTEPQAAGSTSRCATRSTAG
jgi:hypothetical protein